MQRYFAVLIRPLILVAGAALVTGCGGGGGNGSAAGGTGATGASATTPSATQGSASPAVTAPQATTPSAGGNAQKAVVLGWIPPTANADGTPLSQLAGYRVLYGRAADNLDQSVTIEDPSILDCVLEDLTSGIWYFAVVTRNVMGIEGPPSNVVSKMVG